MTDISINQARLFRRHGIWRRGFMRSRQRGFELVAAATKFLPPRFRPVFCLGDSHISVWNYVDMYAPGLLPRFLPLPVQGATALGLANPNSKTNALETFNSVLRRMPLRASVLFNLGEVDCGFVVWLIAARDGLDPQLVFARALGAYQKFIDTVAEAGFRVIVCAAPLPTLSDDGGDGEVAHLRKAVNVSQAERTRMTVDWNSAMQSFCLQRSLRFIGTDSILLNSATSLIDPRFKNVDPTDHHLDNWSYAYALLMSMREMQKTSTRVCEDR